MQTACQRWEGKKGRGEGGEGGEVQDNGNVEGSAELITDGEVDGEQMTELHRLGLKEHSRKAFSRNGRGRGEEQGKRGNDLGVEAEQVDGGVGLNADDHHVALLRLGAESGRIRRRWRIERKIYRN